MARPRVINHDLVVSTYKSGLSVRATATKLGISHWYAMRIISRARAGRPIATANKMKCSRHDEKHAAALELYKSGLSSDRVAEMVDYSAAHIRKITRNAGISRNPKEARRIAKPREPKLSVRIGQGGYVIIQIGSRRWQLHRLVAEVEIIKRKLRPGEIVHHKNGIRSDNRPENLEVLPSASHHRREHKSNEPCAICGKRDLKARFLCDPHYQQIKKQGRLNEFPLMRKPYDPSAH